MEYARPTTANASDVASRDDFANFLLEMLDDFRATGREEWENTTLERFLDAFSAFASARVNNQPGQEEAGWQLFAEMIVAATVYE